MAASPYFPFPPATALILPIFGLVVSLLRPVLATDHIVGANRGWQLPSAVGPSVNLNYTDWARNHTFYLGDSLTFRYQRDMHSVFQVNYSTYVNCTINMYVGHDWIYNWSNKVGRVLIPLNETKAYYFVCGFGGHCQQGMKVAINVTKPPPNKTSEPSPRHSSSDASSLFVTAAALMGALIYATLWLLL